MNDGTVVVIETKYAAALLPATLINKGIPL